MTDLQEHVEAPGRADLVKQVAEKIKETGVDYIYYQFVSVTGRIVGKGIPAAHWERLAEKGFQLVYGSTANLFVDRHGDYIGYGPESSELVGIPDPETFCQLPWDKRIGRVFCTLFRNREERENAGGALSSDCRGNLRRIHKDFQDKHGHGCVGVLLADFLHISKLDVDDQLGCLHRLQQTFRYFWDSLPHRDVVA